MLLRVLRTNGSVGGPLDIRLSVDGLGGDIGVGAEGLSSWEVEKLRKSMCRGPPEPEDAEAEPASVAREASRGSGPREGGLPDSTLDPPALTRFGAGGESGDRSRVGFSSARNLLLGRRRREGRVLVWRRVGGVGVGSDRLWFERF